MWRDSERTNRVAGRLGDDRRAIQQPRHMDTAKYLFEVGGALAQSARSCGAFGNRGTTEPFCLAVAFNGGQEGSFLIVPHDTLNAATWYNGDNQVGWTKNYPSDGDMTVSANNLHNVGLKSTMDLKTGFEEPFLGPFRKALS